MSLPYIKKLARLAQLSTEPKQPKPKQPEWYLIDARRNSTEFKAMQRIICEQK